MRGWPWRALGIARTGDKVAIRRAYADRLRGMDLDREIDAYAELRAARDAALREASESSPLLADEDADVLAKGFQPAHGHESDGTQPGLDWPVEEHDFEFEWDDVGLHDVPQRHYGAGADPDPPAMAAEDGLEEETRRLGGLLFPNAEYSDEPFTWPEFEQAQAAVEVILEHALEGDIARHSAVDEYLAEMFAQAWPRSAPLLERVSVAFGWLDQSGVIVERPALQFLNPRLRGMRFADKVEQPEHPLHKAWEELKRPGKRSFLDALRIKREEVHTLLGGIRERYPEIESYLDGERVASWEKAGPEWVGWIIRRLFVLFVALQLLGFCTQGFDVDRVPREDLDTIAAETFGTGVAMADVQAADPSLNDFLYAVIDRDRTDETSVAVLSERSVQRVREMTATAMEDAPRDDLVEILKLRRDLLAIAAEAGTPGCVGFMRGAQLPDLGGLPADLRARERALAWRLAQAMLLDANYTLREGESMPLPGWVGPGVAERTGLSADRINAVLRGEETDDLCAVRIALIDTLLSRPDDAPIELMRIM